MIQELIDYLLEIAYKHISVNHVGYKREININDQHNTPSIQFIIEDDALLEKQIVEGITTLRINADIIGFVGNERTSLEVQDECLHVALDFIEYINNTYDYPIEVHDYSILSLSEFTDDNSSGVRLTLVLNVPNPINLCEYREHFIEKPIEPIPEVILSNGDDCTNSTFTTSGNGLKLNPIKLR